MSIINTGIITPNIISNNIIQPSIIDIIDGVQILKPTIGWTGDAGCTNPSDVQVTVNFSKDVTYTDHTGVFITHDNGGEFTITGPVSNTTNIISYEGSWDIEPANGDIVIYNYSSGNYIDGDSVAMEDVTINIVNCVHALLEIINISVEQSESPHNDTILRSQFINIEFNQPVTASNITGITATVHNNAQFISLSGSGTTTLKYTLQRAIFRHEVTWAYDGTGDIKSAFSGELLGAVTETIATNNLPPFTVWDYDVDALNANTDTTWDSDETRFDEE